MKVLVLGAGTMGAGIAQVVAEAGNSVVLRDIDQKFVTKGISGIDKNLAKAVEKGKMAQADKDAVMSRITGIVNLKDAGEVDLVIEAVIERMDLKKQIYKELEELFPAETIFASNTSALSITEIASVTKRADKVIGMHFFNPAPVMKLVEVIKGAATSAATYETIVDFTKKLGKTPVTVEEAPGFVVNRILCPMMNEAAFILQEGIATAEDIDIAMKLGANHPIGPLALADPVVVAFLLFVCETLYTRLVEPTYRPCPLLKKMVRAGYLGRKTGRGFYTY